MAASRPVDTIPQGEGRTKAYAWYVVGVLTACQILAAVDTTLPYIIVESLKADLNLSDTQIGLITGPAFALTYAIFALPIARLSDRRHRVWIISCAIAVWSGVTAAASMTRGFGSLAATRMGVALGESALTPAAHSLIANYLPPHARAKAIAIYSFGIAIGSVLALTVGGYLADTLGWRATFAWIGAAGLVLAVLVATTVREPMREPVLGDALPQGGIVQLFSLPAFRHVVAGAALVGFSSGALDSWAPAYIMRTFDLTATATGSIFGAVAGSVAMVGMLAGGFIGSWLARRDAKNSMRMLATVLAAAMVAQLVALSMSGFVSFLIFLAVAVLFSTFYLGPTFAAVQSMVDPRSRSYASAVTLFCINGVGVACGAAVVGLLSDLFAQWQIHQSLKWALIVVSLGKGWAALHYAVASRRDTPFA